MKTLLILLAGVVAGAPLTRAQSPGEAFWLIRIVQMDSGPGLDPSLVDAYRAAGSGVDVLGLRSATGPSQLWMVEAHSSFGSLEDLDKALARTTPDRQDSGLGVGDWLLARTSTLLGLYRPGLSYRPEEALKLLSGARYFRVTVFHIRPGADIEFGELMKMRRFGLESVNLDRPELGYQVISGASSGTYVFLSPVATLTAMDNGIARMPVYAEEASLGSGKSGRQAAADALLGRESLLFRVEPRASYVSAAFAGSDAEFWHPRPPE